MLEFTAWKKPVKARVAVPGDKSLTHRGILFSALAEGEMILEHWLDAADTRASVRLVQALGVEVRELSPERLVLERPRRLQEAVTPIDAANSGTTMRLGAGLAAAVHGLTVLYGDASLSRRPMARVVEPLRAMGVQVLAREGGFAPLAIQGGRHQGGQFTLAVASAQVKSSLLLAGLTAEDPVRVIEPALSRDHTERLIAAMGGNITRDGLAVTVYPGSLHAMAFRVPGDPSSGAFWAAIAALDADRAVTVESMLFNPTRTGFYRVLAQMGASVHWDAVSELPEPWGHVEVRGRVCRPVVVEGADIPQMIDEVPLVALLATQCEGTTVIRGAEELRVKESDRIQVTGQILRSLGAQVEDRPDGWVIEGPTRLHGAEVDARGDHRMAMLAAVAATVAESPVRLRGEDAVRISYPDFFAQYHALQPEG
ncbi:MAG: 3-phosphoshikimate 1-carboxyvinyltransferase [Firmicutes bacterium]|nr:3-phosphoshikimate 1-carboxyvinyltransferase [Bacillota bacterium]